MKFPFNHSHLDKNPTEQAELKGTGIDPRHLAPEPSSKIKAGRRSSHLRTHTSSLTLLCLCPLWGSCSELTKLIPASPDPIPAGLLERDPRSSFSPSELFFDPDRSLYGLRSDMQAAKERFSPLGLETTRSQLESYLEIGDSLTAGRFLSSEPATQPEARAFLASQPRLPSARDVAAAIDRFEEETPNLKSNVAAVLDSTKDVPLVYRSRSEIFRHDAKALKASGFKLLRAPPPLFSGISTTFDPSLRSAEEAGINQAEEALFGDHKASSVESMLIFGRSLQPDNEFQAVMECARVRIEAPAPELGDPGASLPERGPWQLSLIWPRALITESSPSLLDRSPPKPGQLSRGGSEAPSTLVLELRPSIVVTSATPSDGTNSPLPGGRSVSLQSAPISIEAKLVRTPQTLTLDLSRHPYDGASQSESFSLFHEARQFFFFRFSSVVTRVTDLRFVLASFQIPYAVRHFEARSLRNEDGQWRNTLSTEQAAFFQTDEGATGLTAPPDDRWTQASPVQIFKADNTLGRLDLEPETAEGALHHLDPKSLAISFAKTVPSPTSRRKASDSSLSENDYEALEELCRNLFESE